MIDCDKLLATAKPLLPPLWHYYSDGFFWYIAREDDHEAHELPLYVFSFLTGGTQLDRGLRRCYHGSQAALSALREAVAKYQAATTGEEK